MLSITQLSLFIFAGLSVISISINPIQSAALPKILSSRSTNIKGQHINVKRALPNILQPTSFLSGIPNEVTSTPSTIPGFSGLNNGDAQANPTESLFNLLPMPNALGGSKNGLLGSKTKPSGLVRKRTPNKAAKSAIQDDVSGKGTGKGSSSQTGGDPGQSAAACYGSCPAKGQNYSGRGCANVYNCQTTTT